MSASKWLLALSCVAVCQTPPSYRFEVASVKPVTDVPGQIPVVRTYISDDRVSIVTSFKTLAGLAYDAKWYQMVAPDWMGTARFEVQANLPAGAGKQHVQEMLQALLAERLGLAARWETSEGSVYAITVSKNGPKFAESGLVVSAEEKPTSKINLAQGVNGFTATTYNPTGPFGPSKLSMVNGVLRMEFLSVTMPQLAEYLSQGQLGLPVIDRTELKGPYHLTLVTSSDDMRETFPIATPSVADPDQVIRGSRAYAIRSSLEALGLRVERVKAPVRKLVVDRANKTSTEN
jgi:uncharacterized protein (TIGR03435 family)